MRVLNVEELLTRMKVRIAFSLLELRHIWRIHYTRASSFSPIGIHYNGVRLQE